MYSGGKMAMISRRRPFALPTNRDNNNINKQYYNNNYVITITIISLYYNMDRA